MRQCYGMTPLFDPAPLASPPLLLICNHLTCCAFPHRGTGSWQSSCFSSWRQKPTKQLQGPLLLTGPHQVSQEAPQRPGTSHLKRTACTAQQWSSPCISALLRSRTSDAFLPAALVMCQHTWQSRYWTAQHMLGPHACCQMRSRGKSTFPLHKLSVFSEWGQPASTPRLLGRPASLMPGPMTMLPPVDFKSPSMAQQAQQAVVQVVQDPPAALLKHQHPPSVDRAPHCCQQALLFRWPAPQHTLLLHWHLLQPCPAQPHSGVWTCGAQSTSPRWYSQLDGRARAQSMKWCVAP